MITDPPLPPPTHAHSHIVFALRTDIAKDNADVKTVSDEVAALFEAELEEEGEGAAAAAFDDDVESDLETTLAVLQGLDALQRVRGAALGVTPALLSPFAQTLLDNKV